MTRTRPAFRPLSRVGAAFAAALALVVFPGCSKLHQVFSLSGPQSTMVTEGPVARAQWDLFMITVYVTMFIFVVVGAVLAYAQIKFRAKTEAEEHAEPAAEAGHGNPFVEIGLIAGSVALLVIIAIPTLRDIWYTYDVPQADVDSGNSMDVTATGYQWWFKFDYNSETVQLPGGGEAQLSTSNELVVPAGFAVRVHLRTIDVIHSFWIPKLAGKVDMMPNRANHLWFKADKPGYYYGQCAEYCGESHAIMKFRVIALSPSEYVKWLENQKNAARTATPQAIAAESQVPQVSFASLNNIGPGSTFAGSTEFDANPFAAWQAQQKPAANENPALISEGRKIFAAKQCVNCHTVRGHEGGGVTAPDLTHVGSRSTIAAGVLENTPERLHQWLKDPEYFKPGNKMYHGVGAMKGYLDLDANNRPIRGADGEYVRNIDLTDGEIDALVAYLHSLK